MWKIDFLMASENIRKMVNDEAANADVIIIAASSFVQPELRLIQWLQELVTGKTDGTKPGLLIGLLGDEYTETSEIDWVVKAMIEYARQTGRSFIWHRIGKHAMNDFEWLTKNIETLLDGRVFSSEMFAVIRRRLRALIENLWAEAACRRVNFTAPDALSAGRRDIGPQGFRPPGCDGLAPASL
jgi:hypothetical protein